MSGIVCIVCPRSMSRPHHYSRLVILREMARASTHACDVLGRRVQDEKHADGTAGGVSAAVDTGKTLT